MFGLYSEARLPTVVGAFRLRVYEEACDSGPTAIIAGDCTAFATPTPARVHIACFLSENLGYVGCDCRERLSFALETIAARGGVVVYLRRDSARHGLGEEIRRRSEVVAGHGVLDASSAAEAAKVFLDLGISAVRLIGDDGGQADALAAHGITVAEHVPAEPAAGTRPLDLPAAFRLTSPLVHAHGRRGGKRTGDRLVPRPFIHVNFAAADDADPSACVSCDADWRRVHRLRERYDAVAVGARTWNIDHPRLTVRPERLGREPRRQPAKAVFAGSHHCDVAGDGSRLFVIGSGCGCDGATLIPAAGHELAPPLEALYEHGIRSMLVEGGPTILHSFFTQQLADAVTVFVRAGSAEAAHRAAIRALPSLPLQLTARRFGEGFLLAARMTAL